MSLLSSLEKFGLGNFKSEKVFDEGKQEQKEEAPPKEPETVAAKPALPEEKTLVFEKKYQCPVCDKPFTSLTVRTGKVHMREQEIDLHPIFDLLDEIKYDIVACPNCGYAALARYFATPVKRQIEAIRTNIGAKYKPQTRTYEIYTYEDALERYQLALVNAIVKDAKPSEKAYLCLRYAWLIRGMLRDEETMARVATTPDKKAELEAHEKELLKNALDGFVTAKQSEEFPIAGMNTITLDYLLAALFMENGEYEKSIKLIGEILVSKTASSHTKDKARDMKDIIDQRVKAAKAAKEAGQ